MCSACGNTDTVSSEPSSPAKKTVSAQPENPDTQAFKSEVKTTQAENWQWLLKDLKSLLNSKRLYIIWLDLNMRQRQKSKRRL